MIKVCENCKDAKHDQCVLKTELGVRCYCQVCREAFEKTFRIDEAIIKNDGRCLQFRVGNTTHFVDVRDLVQCPTFLDRHDNLVDTRKRIAKDIDEDKNELDVLIKEKLVSHGGFVRGRQVFNHVKMTLPKTTYAKVLGRLKVMKNEKIIQIAKLPRENLDDQTITYLNLYKLIEDDKHD